MNRFEYHTRPATVADAIAALNEPAAPRAGGWHQSRRPHEI